MSRQVPAGRTEERGSAAVLVAAACATVIVLGAGAATVTSAAYASARARSAADLSALAGATVRVQQLLGASEGDPCSAAARVAAGNGAALTACAVDGAVNVTVSVSAPVAGLAPWTGGGSTAVASARAGPADP